MFPQLGMMEMVVVMGVAVLLFGKRLPEVGRSLGKGIIEFKKGLRGLEDEFNFSPDGSSTSAAPARRVDDRDPASSSSAPSPAPPHPAADLTVPKFEPPTSAPVPHREFEAQATQD